MSYKFGTLKKQEVFSLLLNFIVGYLVVIMLPIGQAFLLKLPIIILFPIIYYISFFIFIKKINYATNFVARVGIILAWLLFISFVVIFCTFIVTYLSSSIMHYHGFILIVVSLFGALLGLVFTSPVWLSLTVVNAVILKCWDPKKLQNI